VGNYRTHEIAPLDQEDLEIAMIFVHSFGTNNDWSALQTFAAQAKFAILSIPIFADKRFQNQYTAASRSVSYLDILQSDIMQEQGTCRSYLSAWIGCQMAMCELIMVTNQPSHSPLFLRTEELFEAMIYKVKTFPTPSDILAETFDAKAHADNFYKTYDLIVKRRRME
jgi:hypothetical protein